MPVPEKTPQHYFHCGAGDWNAFARAANAHLANESVTPPPPVPKFRNASVVRVRNEGSPVSRFAVLGINDVVLTPTDNLADFQNVPVFEVGVPDIDFHRGRFVIALEPLDTGDIGKAVVTGLAVCVINMRDTDHRWAEVSDGVSILESTATGTARILWVESGTGLKWAIVRLGNTVHHVEYGKPTAQFYSGSTITLNLCEEDGTLFDGPITATVHLSARQGNFECPIETTDVLAFVRYEDPVATEGVSPVNGVVIGFPNGDYSNPKPLYATVEGLEAAQTGDDEKWLRSDPGNWRGVKVPVISRVVYKHDGNKKLYGYMRLWTIDSLGTVHFIDDEERFEIDAPTDCTEE